MDMVNTAIRTKVLNLANELQLMFPTPCFTCPTRRCCLVTQRIVAKVRLPDSDCLQFTTNALQRSRRPSKRRCRPEVECDLFLGYLEVLDSDSRPARRLETVRI